MYLGVVSIWMHMILSRKIEPLEILIQVLWIVLLQQYIVAAIRRKL